MKKTVQFNMRVSEDKKTRLDACSEIVGMSTTSLVDSCLDAIVGYVEEFREITLPISIVTPGQKEMLARVERAEYSADLYSITIRRLSLKIAGDLDENRQPTTQALEHAHQILCDSRGLTDVQCDRLWERMNGSKFSGSEVVRKRLRSLMPNDPDFTTE